VVPDGLVLTSLCDCAHSLRCVNTGGRAQAANGSVAKVHDDHSLLQSTDSWAASNADAGGEWDSPPGDKAAPGASPARYGHCHQQCSRFQLLVFFLQALWKAFLPAVYMMLENLGSSSVLHGLRGRSSWLVAGMHLVVWHSCMFKGYFFYKTGLALLQAFFSSSGSVTWTVSSTTTTD
jgi:hypothetical protein